MRKILVVEDDKMLNRGITFNLEQDGFEVLSATSIEEAKDIYNKNQLDMIILDVNLPDGSGFDLCKSIREESNLPIIFLTALDMEFDVVTGFKLGADDYITKPFSLSILRERVFAIFRRFEVKDRKANAYKTGNIIIDFERLILKKDGEKIDITPTEFKLLKALVVSKSKVLTRSNLLEELWDKDSNFVDEHALTVNINRLRSKIGDKPSGGNYIKTVYGIGYMWEECEE